MTKDAGAYATNCGGSGKGVHPFDVDAQRHLVVKRKEVNRIKMRTLLDLLIGGPHEPIPPQSPAAYHGTWVEAKPHKDLELQPADIHT
jgi:hypothetical protein